VASSLIQTDFKMKKHGSPGSISLKQVSYERKTEVKELRENKNNIDTCRKIP
jgi:hypothetical protein